MSLAHLVEHGFLQTIQDQELSGGLGLVGLKKAGKGSAGHPSQGVKIGSPNRLSFEGFEQLESSKEE